MAGAALADASRVTNRTLAAFSCAWPAIALATLVLLPFLNTPFTIDDPVYLAEAQHVAEDPLHPQALDIVWGPDVEMRASNLQPGNNAAPYILVPTVLAGNKEWVAHLTQITLLSLALFGTALVGLRLGLDRHGARAAALLAATAPAVLGMAGTAMPDVATMTYSVLGMERILAWRKERKWHQGLLAVAWLALCALTRVHTILLLAPAFVFLLDGIAGKSIRSSFGPRWTRFAPIIGIPFVDLLMLWVTADPLASSDSDVQTSAIMIYTNLRIVARNVCAYFIHWVLTAPLTLPWLVLRWPKLSRRVVAAAILCAAALGFRMGWAPMVAAATAIVMWDIFSDSLRRGDRDQFALALWLLPALAPAVYHQLPAKYIVPLIPAAAILVARALGEAHPVWRRWLPAATIAAGLAVSLLVLTGTRALAQAQRRAVQELVVPRVQAGEHVWFAGHWGFHWYAEAAGAKPAVWQGRVPQPGDVVVVSLIDQATFPAEWKSKRVIQRAAYDSPGRVMDARAGAGFFSNMFGYLPWVWATGEANVFEIWKVE